MSAPTPEDIEAARLRFQASMHDLQASTLRMRAAMATARAGLQALMSATQGSYDQELAGHPDLAELNVMMDGYYGGPTS